MKEFENNAHFWQKLDTLYLSSDFRLAHKKGDVHPRNKDLIFPFDYGYINTKDNGEESLIAVYKGTTGKKIDAVVVCADILKKSIEVKLLIGLTDEEEEILLRFLNINDMMKTVLIKRGKEIPSWAVTD